MLEQWKAEFATYGQVTLRQRRTWAAVTTVIGLPLLLAAAYMALAPSTWFRGFVSQVMGIALTRVVGWVGLAFFGLALLMSLRSLINPRAVAQLDQRGILLRGRDFVPWDKVEGLTVRTASGIAYPVLKAPRKNHNLRPGAGDPRDVQRLVLWARDRVMERAG